MWHLNEDVTKLILGTNEATFTRNDVNNVHNNHVWTLENPDVVENGVLIVPSRLKGEIYLDSFPYNH